VRRRIRTTAPPSNRCCVCRTERIQRDRAPHGCRVSAGRGTLPAHHLGERRRRLKLARGVGLHNRGCGSVGGDPCFASLSFQLISQDAQLSRDSQIKGVVRKEPAAPGQFHEIRLRRHKHHRHAVLACIAGCVAGCAPSRGKSPDMVKRRLGSRLPRCAPSPTRTWVYPSSALHDGPSRINPTWAGRGGRAAVADTSLAYPNTTHGSTIVVSSPAVPP
jgi:hypothetical protein